MTVYCKNFRGIVPNILLSGNLVYSLFLIDMVFKCLMSVNKCQSLAYQLLLLSSNTPFAHQCFHN